MLAEACKQVGFSVISRGRNIEFHIFYPHGREFSPLLTVSHAADTVAVLLRRIYYRQELLAELGASSLVGSDPLTAYSDAALVAAITITSEQESWNV